MARFKDRRARMKLAMQSSPFNFPPGLAHVVASVAEPRSDGFGEDARLDRIVEEHRERLITELENVIPEEAAEDTGLRPYGGRVEDVVEQAAERLRLVAEEHGAEHMVARLDRLEDERRFGISNSESLRSMSEIEIDPDTIPRSSVSGRRVGVWR